MYAKLLLYSWWKEFILSKIKICCTKIYVFFKIKEPQRQSETKENLIGEILLSMQYSIVDPEKQNDDQLPFGGFVDRTRCTLGPT